MLRQLWDRLQQWLELGPYARSFGALRSSAWPRTRATHLLKEPRCRVCGGNDRITVHHIRPFHLHPELELDPANLITLCEGAGNGNHHLIFGHWGNYRTKFNPEIQTESTAWLSRFVAVGSEVDGPGDEVQ